jgi:hypothetical protein
MSNGSGRRNKQRQRKIAELTMACKSYAEMRRKKARKIKRRTIGGERGTEPRNIMTLMQSNLISLRSQHLNMRNYSSDTRHRRSLS